MLKRFFLIAPDNTSSIKSHLKKTGIPDTHFKIEDGGETFDTFGTLLKAKVTEDKNGYWVYKLYYESTVLATTSFIGSGDKRQIKTYLNSFDNLPLSLVQEKRESAKEADIDFDFNFTDQNYTPR